MQRNAELDDSQVTGEVSGSIFDDRAQGLADFSSELSQLFAREAVQFLWRPQVREQFQLHLVVSFQNETRQGFQSMTSITQAGDRASGILNQLLCPSAAFCQS